MASPASPPLSWIGFRLRIAEVGEHLVAVADGDGGVVRFAVAQVAEADGRSGPAAGDFVDQVVAVLDGAAVDGGDDVARLEAGLVRGAAWLNLLHQHAVLEAVDAVDGAGQALRGTEMPMEPRVTLWLGLMRSL